jgi:UDP-3-O-[3-hydroxymyristoyl] glucosamine N-acyltransferase
VKIPAHKLSDLAAIINAKFIGDPNHQVTGLNEVHRVEDGDLMFVDHPKYYDKALNSAATTILINKDVECPPGKGLIVSDDPFRDFNKLVVHFELKGHSLDLQSKDAKIGKNCTIYPNVYIGRDVTIGDNCVIKAGVFIADHTIIGNNVIIHPNVTVGGEAFYYKRRAEYFDKLLTCGRVIIKDDVEIGAGCTLDRGVTADTIIGKGTKLDNLCHIGHDTVVGEMCLFAAGVAIAGVTTVEDRVTLWGRVSVTSDVVLGKGCVVLATSAVSKSTEPGKTYFGAPAEEARGKWRELAAIRQLPDFLAANHKKSEQ